MATLVGGRRASSSASPLSSAYSPTAGNTLVIFCQFNTSTSVTAGSLAITDNGSGSSGYVNPTGGFNASGSFNNKWILYCVSCGTGITSVTATLTGGGTISFSELWVIELNAAGAFDVCSLRNMGSWSTGANNMTGTAVTTTAANDFAVAAFDAFTGGGTLSAGTIPITWTAASSVANQAAGFNFAEVGTFGAAGSYTAAATDSVADTGGFAYTIAFSPPVTGTVLTAWVYTV